MSALDKLYSMLREADQLGLSRSARLRLIGIIGSFENEELDRYRGTTEFSDDRERRGERECSRRATDPQRPHSRDDEKDRVLGSRY